MIYFKNEYSSMTIIINKILRKSTLKQNELGIIIKKNEQYLRFQHFLIQI